jgi:hypothetical protein
LQAIKAGADWQRFLARTSGRYYIGQVRLAVQQYQEKYHVSDDDIETNLPGFSRWLKENKNTK